MIDYKMSDVVKTISIIFTVIFILFLCYIVGINIYKYFKLEEQKMKILEDEFSKLPKD